MIKLFTTNSRPAEVELATPLNGLTRLSVSRPVAPWSRLPPRLFQGNIECAWYSDLGTLLDAHEVGSVAALLALPESRCLAEENVIVDGTVPATGEAVKMTAILKRRADITREQFLDHYPNVHAPMVRRTPELTRYVQNYAIAEAHSDGLNGFDGVAELWWASHAIADRSWGSREIQEEQANDSPRFLGAGGALLVGDEVVLVS